MRNSLLKVLYCLRRTRPLFCDVTRGFHQTWLDLAKQWKTALEPWAKTWTPSNSSGWLNDTQLGPGRQRGWSWLSWVPFGQGSARTRIIVGFVVVVQCVAISFKISWGERRHVSFGRSVTHFAFHRQKTQSSRLVARENKCSLLTVKRKPYLHPGGTPIWKGRGCSSGIFVLTPKRY